MTLLELRTELWEELGEPSSLDPGAAFGQTRLDRWVNKAYKKILFWKYPDGTQLRFPCTEGELFFQTVTVTGTCANGTTTTVTFDTVAGANDDQYNGWCVSVGGAVREVVAYDGASRTATVHDTWGTAPTAADAYTLFKRFMRLCEVGDVGAGENIVLSPVSSFMEVQKITDIKRYIDLQPARREDAFSMTILSVGVPRQYLRRRNDIIFDYPVNATDWYRMEYARMPPDLVLDTDEPEIPTYWDDAILLWATYRGNIYMQDSALAYSRKRDLMDFMTLSRSQGEMQYERENGQAEVDLR